MNIAKQRALIVLVSGLLAFLPFLGADSCGPDLPFAVFVNQCHPDLPLSLFAAGHLGIIQPGWAKSYLCVAFRFLVNNPLDASEQASILRLWHSRLDRARFYDAASDSDPIAEYLIAREKALGKKVSDTPYAYAPTSSYSYQENICRDAFVVAKRTLLERIKHYGVNRSPVREWIKGQDAVFGIDNQGEQSIPSPLPAAADPLAKADRAYQIAAATFYKKDYPQSLRLFEQISKDEKSPWKGIASYMVARCKANIVLKSDSENDDVSRQTISYLESRIKVEQDQNTRADLFDLLRPITYMTLDMAEQIGRVVSAVTAKHSERFGGDVGDLTFLMDEGTTDDSVTPEERKAEEAEIAKHDLTDWLNTLQRTIDPYAFYSVEEQKALTKSRSELDKHAIAMWRANHTVHWLVAALCLNGLRSPDLKDLYSAASKIPSSSPAYLTASFFVVDALIAANKHSEARSRLSSILARQDLPPSTRNLFKAEMLPVCTTSAQYLSSSIISPPEVCYDTLQLPENWSTYERKRSYHSDAATLEPTVAKDLNRNLPLSLWVGLSLDKDVPSGLRGRVIRSTWLRAHLLGKQDIARRLSPAFAAACPVLAKQIKQVDTAPDGDAMRFALAGLVLKTFGMTPYVEDGVARNGNAIKEFDQYNANFWLPERPSDKPDAKTDADTMDDNYQSHWWSDDPARATNLYQMMRTYSKPGIKRVLTAQQRREGDNERLTIWNNAPSRFLGEAVFAWAKEHPNDPQIPELLYRVVRLPKWTAVTDVGSKYSHKAYILIHSRYPKTKWAAKATCWY